MSNGENHRKGVSGEGEPLPEAEALVEPAEVRAERDTAAKEPDIPDVFKTVKQEVYRRFGFWGLVALALVGCFGWVWWNWEDVRQRPFVQEVVAWIERDELGPADSGRFTVAIARLENDPERKYEGLIFESLNEAFSTEDENAVQILRFDRMIERDGGDLEAAVQQAHRTARVYLDETAADLLIWGAVLGSGEENIPKLYWTTARDLDRARDWGRYATDDLALPEIFWKNLADVLRLLVVTRDAEIRSLVGHFVADRLVPFVERIRSLLAGGEQGWTDDARARVGLVLADSLSTLGRQAGINVPLGEAIEVYRTVLNHYTREKVPLHWAATQNNLGAALKRLGERESGTKRLEEAVAACRAALEERTREKVPLNWAMTQNNLGNALRRLGERESGTARLEQAVEAYRAALEERTPEKVALKWAMTQNNLGNALRSLGERSRDTELVCDAVGAHLAAWEVFTHGKADHYEAMAKRGVEADLAVLKNVAEAAEHERCLEQHRAGLDAISGRDN